MSPSTTKLEQLEQENARLRQQLAECQKMTALGELMGTTTHEFNNILMTVINYAKLAMRNKDEAHRDKALGKILAAGERAAKITHGVLGMARNRGNDFQQTCLKAIVEETLFLLEKEMQKHRIEVAIHLDDVPEISAIGNQVQQVLLNLLINARQAIGEDGRIDVQLRHEKSESTVSLVVRDYGPGMTPDKLQKIFQPYFTTKSGPDSTGRGGTGLGLSACKDIVDSHRGKIRVESTVGKGTCFTIKFPMVQSASTPRPHLDLSRFGAASAASVAVPNK